MWWFVPVIFFWILYRAGARRTFLFSGLFIFTVVMLLLSFVVGGLLSFIFGGANTIRHWEISDGLTSLIVHSDFFFDNLWVAMFIPILFLVDILCWIVQITVFQGTIVLWLVMAFGIWNIWRGWHICLDAYLAGLEERYEAERN